MVQLYDLLVLYRDKLIAKGVIISNYLNSLINSLSPSKVKFSTVNNITSCQIQQGLEYPVLDYKDMSVVNYTLDSDLPIPNILTGDAQLPSPFMYSIEKESVESWEAPSTGGSTYSNSLVGLFASMMTSSHASSSSISCSAYNNILTNISNDSGASAGKSITLTGLTPGKTYEYTSEIKFNSRVTYQNSNSQTLTDPVLRFNLSIDGGELLSDSSFDFILFSNVTSLTYPSIKFVANNSTVSISGSVQCYKSDKTTSTAIKPSVYTKVGRNAGKVIINNTDQTMYLKIAGYGESGQLMDGQLEANTSSPGPTQLALATFKFDQNDNVYDINVLV